MPILFTCQNGHQLRARDETAGTSVRCPRCQAMVEVPLLGIRPEPASPRAATGARNEDEPDEAGAEDGYGIQAEADEGLEPDDELTTRKRSRRRRVPGERPDRSSTKGLDKVKLGLDFHHASIIALLPAAAGSVLYLVFLLGVFILALGRGLSHQGSDDLLLAVIVASYILLAVCSVPFILAIIGSAYCLRVPARANAKGFIIASLVLTLSAIPVSILLSALLKGRSPAFSGLGTILLMGSTAWALFMLFLRSLCDYLDQSGLAREARDILARGLLFLILTPVVFFVAGFLTWVMACLGFIGLILAAVVFFYGLYHAIAFHRRQLVLLRYLREVIASRL